MSTAPHIPDWFVKKLADAGGKSFTGKPRLRVVWGPEQRDHLGRYKYIKPTGGHFEAFMLERYQEAGFFGTPDEWNKDRNFYDDISQTWVDVKGPYPSAGAYTLVMPLTDGDGNYIALTEAVCNEVLRKIRNDIAWASLTHDERLQYLQSEDEREAQQREYEREQADGERDEYYKRNWGQINRGMTRAYNFTPA